MNQTLLLQVSQAELQNLIADTVRTELSQFLPAPTDKETDTEEMLRVPDIQEMFGVCKQTVLSWSKSGKLPTIRIGGRIFFPKSAVLALLKASTGRAQS